MTSLYFAFIYEQTMLSNSPNHNSTVGNCKEMTVATAYVVLCTYLKQATGRVMYKPSLYLAGERGHS